MAVDEASNSSEWSREQDKAFENALATYPEDTSDRWEKIAADVPGKTLEEIKQHYELLEDDVNRIESGCVPLPAYSSSEGSTCHAGDEVTSKKGSDHLGHFNSESDHGSKNSRSDQERRKGIAWTEDEHRMVCASNVQLLFLVFCVAICGSIMKVLCKFDSDMGGKGRDNLRRVIVEK
ncbi:hypothetical protein Goarm_006799 [Gossypium armourianum]|uniref:Uncharacterized protein n=1 Tax=Gossypium armourianum TaxID=34283 RepID=A0A7J9JKZ4_9ROSI|nr:hypothetical protein [Gossypium armourianum]